MADPLIFSNAVNILIASCSCANSNLDHHTFGAFKRFQTYGHCLEMVHASVHDVTTLKPNDREIAAWGAWRTHLNFQILRTFWMHYAAVVMVWLVTTALVQSKDFKSMHIAVQVKCARINSLCANSPPKNLEIAAWGAWLTNLNFQVLRMFWLLHELCQ